MFVAAAIYTQQIFCKSTFDMAENKQEQSNLNIHNQSIPYESKLLKKILLIRIKFPEV